MIYFIAALYNEISEVNNLLIHVADLVDGYRIVDDGSTDPTPLVLDQWSKHIKEFEYKILEHTGLPETVKHRAKEMVPNDDDWCLMLDADERFTDETKNAIKQFFNNGDSLSYDYIYFNQKEIIDGQHVRSFQKCKLFRKRSVKFPLHNIHADDQFSGYGDYFGWEVLHRKSSQKQMQREVEYLRTYDRLFEEGHIDEGRREWLKGLHHFYKEVPHG